ncbi:MAG: MFS transporter [Reichenbachiella sp.]|uniref:MFS transporter n=1 Tax=Reichenbachiella sp. TaxID=2184521 RepID=UPI003263AE29
MKDKIQAFYQKSLGKPFKNKEGWENEFKKRKWSVFLTITFGYGFYYVCRLSFNVIKKPLIDAGVFDAAQLGQIGSAMFFAYAFGKLTNGILADRVNVRRFMATGLLVSGLVNIALGFVSVFWVFVVLWGINGWFQSFGAASSVVALSRWTKAKERGSFYGIWSSSHNIGEAITFIGTAVVVTSLGWIWGFGVSGLLGILMGLLILRYLYEHPGIYGLDRNIVDNEDNKKNISNLQWAVFKNPAIWVLALSSACFYVTRYAVNSWGIFFLETEKGYSTIEAGSIISVNSVVGIAGTFFSGLLSDKFFKGRRNVPALIFGVIYTGSIALFSLGPANVIWDTISMVLFGLSLGVLLVYLGGLMAVDIFPKEVSGTVLGIIGIASYLGAGIQDILSGYFIESGKRAVEGNIVYDFSTVVIFWIGASLISIVLALFVWNSKPHVEIIVDPVEKDL